MHLRRIDAVKALIPLYGADLAHAIGRFLPSKTRIRPTVPLLEAEDILRGARRYSRKRHQDHRVAAVRARRAFTFR